jgi:hypothetical protein
VLQQPARQWRLSDPAIAADIDLWNRLRADRQFLLPGQQRDLDRHLLSGRTDPKRPE